MSLNWSITDIKNWEAVSMKEENGIEGNKTEALIWACMAVDLGSITKKDVDEFFFRVETWEKLRGSFLCDYTMTREDIERRIGLSTNVSNVTRTKWLKKATAPRRF